MSKDTSHHAMVWIRRLPPFDKDVRVFVLSYPGERKPDASFDPCLEGPAHRVAGRILTDVI